ncbi:MAG: hypothetical protein P4L83_24480 [Nevskia sp.]|nr:hypothetical protein [Nevskia sp.]
MNLKPISRDAAEAVAPGCSRRGFVSGLAGSAALLGLSPALAAAAPAWAGASRPGLLWSTRQRSIALAYAEQHRALLQVIEAQSAAVVQGAGRSFVVPVALHLPLRGIQSAWMASDEVLCLLDGHNTTMHRYRIDGTPLGSSRLRDAGQQLAAQGCADGTGGSYLTLPTAHCMVRLSASGEVVQRFGRLGTAEGGLNFPTAVARQDDGSLVVANTGNHRIDRFGADGGFLQTLARFHFAPVRMAVSGGVAAVHDPHAERLRLLCLRDGGMLDALVLPKAPAGAQAWRALSAAGGQRFVVSV